MRLFRFLLRNSRSAVVLTLFFGAVSGALNTLLIAMINTALGDSNQPGFLMWGFAGLCLMLPLTRFVSETLISNLGQDSLYRLRIQLSEQIVATPLRKLEELSAPRLLAALTDDLLVVTAAIYAVPTVSMNAAIVCGGLLYMGWLSPTLFLTVLVFVVIGVITYYVPAKRSLNSIKLAREEGDSLFKHFRSLIEGVKELKLHEGRRAGFLSDVLRPTARAFRRHNVRGMSTYAAANSLGQTLVFALLGLLIFVTPDATGTGAQTLTGYAMILLYIMIPFQLIMNSLPLLGRAEVALRKVEQLGLSPATGSGEAGAARAHGLRAVERLDLVDVTHTYYHDDRHSGEGNMFTLGPINLTFYPGELVFLVGGNGSGKTTLAKLFAGLYSPESGEILVNGVPVSEENREGYRQLFSAVFSDFHLFEKLHVLDSAELGGRAREHLARLHLDHKVQIRDGAFSTTALSQGQRKRLALLTTYLEDRPVYVFDEWAADQDPLFKDVFYNELLPELKARGKIVLVISHDDKYYHVGDRVIKLDYGRVNCVEPHLAGAAANG